MIIRKASSGMKDGAREAEGFLQGLPLEVLFDGNRTPSNVQLRKMILLHDLAAGDGVK
ncbi:MAG: hypothetical protein WBJ42_06670 [Thermovirgaceae bacterium]|nr:hypothetical protein [Synergistales bacterium]HPC75277.1 hypothetical protein [Synergistales bacterium]HRS48287.1 hypothetical protein [Thermovirgaceae bacterium]HRU90520.1 hypothetical protein [Thermovirgaceae bacterium]